MVNKKIRKCRLWDFCWHTFRLAACVHCKDEYKLNYCCRDQHEERWWHLTVMASFFFFVQWTQPSPLRFCHLNKYAASQLGTDAAIYDEVPLFYVSHSFNCVQILPKRLPKESTEYIFVMLWIITKLTAHAVGMKRLNATARIVFDSEQRNKAFSALTSTRVIYTPLHVLLILFMKGTKLSRCCLASITALHNTTMSHRVIIYSDYSELIW